MTAIDALKIACEALKERRAYCEQWEYKYGDEWDNEDGYIQNAIDKLAAIEAEKPAEDPESFLNSIFDAIAENGIITNYNYGMRLTKESHDACIKIITDNHAERCKACRKDRQPLPEAPRV